MQADVREDFQTFCLHWHIFNIGVLSFYFQGQKCLAQTQSHSSFAEECSVLANPSRTSMFSANSILECCLSFHRRAQYVFSWTNLGSHESTSSHISAEPGWKHCPQGCFQYLLKSAVAEVLGAPPDFIFGSSSDNPFGEQPLPRQPLHAMFPSSKCH